MGWKKMRRRGELRGLCVVKLHDEGWREARMVAEGGGLGRQEQWVEQSSLLGSHVEVGD